ncbi:hypothetical protein DLREEDagrD3_12020 [Denitratisoma sp. agr-D3]
MDETVFFESNNVKVTNSRFIVGNQTYAMAAVSSVKVTTTDITPPKTFPLILIVVGAIWLLAALSGNSSASSFLWSIGLIAVGIFWFRSIKPIFEHKIILTTSSGEATALTSRNDQDINPVEKALNDALVFRG